jgi:glyoxalase-like protein
MTVELDHFFILTDVDAPEADHLLRFGLTEGAPNSHPGQGTACRRFFFSNAFLELLWVIDPAETQSSLVRRTGLWERWSRRGRDTSPFGICVRSIRHGGHEMPFPTWEYRPPYLPDPLAIYMHVDSEVATEPLLFYSTFGRRPDAAEASRRQPLQHAADFHTVTRLEVSSPQSETPKALRALEDHCPWLRVVDRDEYLMEVCFDEEAEKQVADFRPQLPLTLRW